MTPRRAEIAGPPGGLSPARVPACVRAGKCSRGRIAKSSGVFGEVVTAGKIRLLLLACVAVALAWGVAPALSLTRYRPEPVDFTQAVPGVSAATAAQRRSARAVILMGRTTNNCCNLISVPLHGNEIGVVLMPSLPLQKFIVPAAWLSGVIVTNRWPCIVDGAAP